jgi:hypothetical protein
MFNIFTSAVYHFLHFSSLLRSTFSKDSLQWQMYLYLSYFIWFSFFPLSHVSWGISLLSNVHKLCDSRSQVINQSIHCDGRLLRHPLKYLTTTGLNTMFILICHFQQVPRSLNTWTNNENKIFSKTLYVQLSPLLSPFTVLITTRSVLWSSK